MTVPILVTLVAAALALSLTLGGNDSAAAREGQEQAATTDDLPVLEYDAADEVPPQPVRRRPPDPGRVIAELPPDVEPLPTNARFWVALPALPVAQSDGVVLGVVTDRRASLRKDEEYERVFSKFTVSPDAVFKDDLGLLAPGATLTATRPGGAVRFSSGKIQRYRISKLGYPRTGRSYVLFLKRDEQGGFNILTGYELRGGRVFPLDGDDTEPRADLVFGKYRGASRETLLNDLRDAVQAARPAGGAGR